MRVPPVSAAKHNGAGSDLVLNDCLAYQRFGRLLASERRLLRIGASFDTPEHHVQIAQAGLAALPRLRGM